MNKKTPIFYINCTFLAILITSVSIVTIQIIQNKEFEKSYWAFKVGISNQNNTPNSVELIYLNLKNSDDMNSSETLSNDYPNSNNLVLMDGDYDTENIDSYTEENKTLLPDSISITYYSFLEKKFYHHKGELPYKKLLESGKEFSSNYVKYIQLTIQPKGVIDVSLNNGHDDNHLPITTLQAKRTDLKIDTLLKKSAANTLTSLGEYDDIMTKKYHWDLQTTLPKDAEITINYYRGGIIYANNQQKEKLDFTPNSVSLRWMQDQCTYIVQYSFDAKEIYNAFENLGNANSGVTVTLKGDRSADGKHFIFRADNGIKSIPLKNIYEEKIRCL